LDAGATEGSIFHSPVLPGTRIIAARLTVFA
jgi:hypothetical protein